MLNLNLLTFKKFFLRRRSMNTIISFVVLLIAMAVLYFLANTPGDFHEIFVWIKSKKEKIREEYDTFQYDLSIIRQILCFLACYIALITIAILSIIHWNCFSILKLYMIITTLFYDFYIAFYTKLLDNLFNRHISKVISIFFLILLYTLLYHFKELILSSLLSPFLILIAYILQFIAWKSFFTTIKKN